MRLGAAKSESGSRRRLLAAMCAALLLIGLIPAHAHAENTGVIRVGYYENEIFQEGAREGAVKTGYSYEYYRKLSEYTGWSYEYVYGDYADLYRMLLNGEIDLPAGLAWREDRVGLLGYPDLAWAMSPIFLSSMTRMWISQQIPPLFPDGGSAFWTVRWSMP